MLPVIYKEAFEVYLKDFESPIILSEKGGKLLQEALQSKDCPPFVRINTWLYNRFEVLRVIPVKVEPFDEWMEELGANEAEKKKIRLLVAKRKKEKLEISKWVVNNMLQHIRDNPTYDANILENRPKTTSEKPSSRLREKGTQTNTANIGEEEETDRGEWWRE